MARDLTKGSIYGHILALAFPAVLSMFAIVANNFIDTALVGHLGNAELAAVGSAGFIIWMIFSLMDIFSIGTVAIISRDIGAGQGETAGEKTRSIFRFSIIFSSILAVIGFSFSGIILRLLNLGPEVESMATVYLKIIFLAVPPMFIGEVIWATFRSVGDTKTPMIIMVSTVVLNIILDILLIYGIWIFPRLETVGAAVATAISHILGTVLGLYFVKKGRVPYRIIPRKLFPIDFSVIGKMFRIGAPVSLSSINFSLVYLAMTRIMSEFGTSAIASIPVGNRAESISYMTCFGFYMAISSIVGQNLGAKSPERAAKAVWTSAGILSIVTIAFSAIFFFLPEQIASLFSNEIDVIKYGADYLRIMAVSQIFMGFEFAFGGAFSGAGHTLPPTIVSIPGTLIRIPLAYYLAIPLGLGPAGIFWAITISTGLKGIAILIWFKFGKWYKK